MFVVYIYIYIYIYTQYISTTPSGRESRRRAPPCSKRRDPDPNENPTWENHAANVERNPLYKLTCRCLLPY